MLRCPHLELSLLRSSAAEMVGDASFGLTLASAMLGFGAHVVCGLCLSAEEVLGCHEYTVLPFARGAMLFL